MPTIRNCVLLGPFRLDTDAGPVRLPRRQVRFLLALLLLEVGRPVPTDRLVSLLWPVRPPQRPRALLQTYVSRIRAALHPVDGIALIRAGEAYQVVTDPEVVDVYRMRDLVERARGSGDDPETRAELARAALGLWSGTPLADTADETTRAGACAGLAELHAQALDLRITADLDRGRHEPLIGELTALLTRQPLQERIAVHLVTALCRSGRRAEALTVCRDVRAGLRTELGLDPGPELQQLELAVLRSDPALAPPPGAATGPATGPVPDQLPPVAQPFVGRTRELAALDQLARPESAAALVISGPPGVGKTALAVRWGQDHRAGFPDGQLYLDLRGHGPDSPLSPLAAAGALLHSLGVPADRIPAELPAATGEFRTAIAGRRVLVLLDNAASVDQVRPVLPAAGAATVIITSRDTLDGLVAVDGARQLKLDPLTPAESLDLLAAGVGARRLTAEPETGAALAAACGHLPLALRIAVTQLAGEPQQSLRAHLAGLRRDPIHRLRLAGDDTRAVQSAFSHSYGRLDHRRQRIFRLVGQVPVAALDPELVAALLPMSREEARAGLGELAAASLLEPRGPDQFGMHDLLHEFAARLTPDPADRAGVLPRLHRYYLHRVDAAARLLYPQLLRLPAPAGTTPEPPADPPFADPDDALRWLTRQTDNLSRLVRHAADHGPQPAGWLLADWLRGFYWLSQETAQWLTVAETALLAAERAGDQAGVCAGRLSLGLASLCLSRYDGARHHLQAGLAAARAAGWSAGEAACLGSLGTTHLELGELEPAETCYRDAMLRNRRLGRTAGEATNRGNLAVVQLLRGRLTVAAENLEQVLAYQRTAGLTASEGLNLANLGLARRETGDLTAAADHLRAAIATHQRSGNRHGEASSTALLASVHCAQGELDRATAEVQRALDLSQDWDDPATESEIRLVLGEIWYRRGEHSRATRHFRRAVELADELRRAHQAIAATISWARVESDGGDHHSALRRLTPALDAAREHGYRHYEGCALTVAAEVHLRRGDEQEARRHADRAVVIHQETGHRPGELRARQVLTALAATSGSALSTPSTMKCSGVDSGVKPSRA